MEGVISELFNKDGEWDLDSAFRIMDSTFKGMVVGLASGTYHGVLGKAAPVGKEILFDIGLGVLAAFSSDLYKSSAFSKDLRSGVSGKMQFNNLISCCVCKLGSCINVVIFGVYKMNLIKEKSVIEEVIFGILF